MSDSGYGHEDIPCMTYDIHVDIFTSMCMGWFDNCMRALRWGVTLAGDYHYWALLTLSWETPFLYRSGASGLPAFKTTHM